MDVYTSQLSPDKYFEFWRAGILSCAQLLYGYNNEYKIFERRTGDKIGIWLVQIHNDEINAHVLVKIEVNGDGATLLRATERLYEEVTKDMADHLEKQKLNDEFSVGQIGLPAPNPRRTASVASQTEWV